MWTGVGGLCCRRRARTHITRYVCNRNNSAISVLSEMSISEEIAEGSRLDSSVQRVQSELLDQFRLGRSCGDGVQIATGYVVVP